jgi:DNA-binding beta-propeller fold protein YncE
VDAITGIITTIAGTGSSGDTGDGGAAILAELNKPGGVFSDLSGNIYIADSDNHRIKKVDATTGIITTVAGTGSSGDAGDDGPAINAQMNKPRGLWVDEYGNILIADTE